MAPSYEGDSDMDETRVCVLDACGDLGAALVDRLLQRGYTVHAATHTLHHPHPHPAGRLKSLESKWGEEQRLKVFEADPLDYHSIVDALSGCSGLFYSFEPPPEYPFYDEHMAELEARAAHNVLEACAQTDTMAKVVFTSSATAIIWRDDLQNPQVSYRLDERHWSDVNLCKKLKLWHGLSKTVAEKAAWALAMDRDVVNMVSINAGLVVGGGSHLSLSHPYLKGAAEMYESGVLVTVELKLLVDAHICVFEDVSSYGRYLCFDHLVNSHQDALNLASMLLPPSPTSLELEDTTVHPQRITNAKLTKLMTSQMEKSFFPAI